MSKQTGFGRPLQRIRAQYRAQILTMLSGDPQGEPDWVKKISDGSDAGFFGPNSAVWHVNGGIPVIVAGIRALLMQTLHPGAMAGVHDHSRYHEDPLGRLAGTVRWVVTTTFGSTEAVTQETLRVSKLHRKVSGTYQPDSSTPDLIPYSASDTDLVTWVHIVFTDAFLTAHRTWGNQIPTEHPGETGEDRYVREWAVAGTQMGMKSPPRSVAELHSALGSFWPVLRVDARVRETLNFLTKPPLPASTRIPYAIMVGGAIATLEPVYRKLLGLRRPWWPARSLTRLVLFLTGAVLGSESTSRKRALERMRRLATESPA